MKDLKVKVLMNQEELRQRRTVSLIASENYVSQDVLDALSSKFINKYSEGYPGKRYYKGQENTDKLETLCKERALKLFDLSDKKWHVNVQPLSGSPANLAVYLALVPDNGIIMGLNLSDGGHLTHGHKVSATGKIWTQLPYHVNKETGLLDYAQLKRLALSEEPSIIVAGFTAYPRAIDFKKFRQIADACGAILMIDMSHTAGLVAGKAYPSPFPYADIVTTTTHKTLRGPRGAIIYCKTEYAEKIDKAVFPGIQGGPHMNQVAAIAVALREAKLSSFGTYARQVVRNAKALAEALKVLGYRIITDGTDSHMLLVDTISLGFPGDVVADMLEKEGIIVNANTIPGDTRSPLSPSGIRLGTAAETTRGADEKDMWRLARRIDEAINPYEKNQ